MAEPIAALIVRILADTSEMVTGVKKATDQLDTFENRISKFSKAVAGYFSVQAIVGFGKAILAEADAIDAAAKRIGAGVEEFQRFSYAVTQSGGDAESATAGIVKLTEKLAEGDKGLLGVLRKLNIDLQTFKAQDAASRFVDLGTAIANVADPTERLELRLEALGVKGEKALAAVDAEFQKLQGNAPVYSKESIKALDDVGDAFDDLWMRVKIGAAESALALKDFFDFSKTQVVTNDGTIKFFGGEGNLPAAPNAPKKNIPGLGPAPLDPTDANALAGAMADLALQFNKAEQEAREAKEQFDSMNWVLRTLKTESINLASAMTPLMAAFDTSTKVDHFTTRIIAAAQQIAALTVETERLMEIINPGSTALAGDDVDRKIFELRSDPRNFQTSGPEKGNLTDQALAIESGLLNNFSLQLLANQLKPSGGGPAPALGSNVPGFASVMNPTSVTINAQGGFWNSPEQINQLGRLVEDVLAGRAKGTDLHSRR